MVQPAESKADEGAGGGIKTDRRQAPGLGLFGGGQRDLSLGETRAGDVVWPFAGIADRWPSPGKR